jgi:hypothetical protein
MDPAKDEPFDREPWRRLLGADRGAPTQGMDRRILAEARRALTPRVARWWLPASLAASLVLAVLIVQWQLADSGAPALVTESDVLSAPAPVAAGDEDAPAAALEAAPQRQDTPATPSGNLAQPAVDVPAAKLRTPRELAAPAAEPAAAASAPPPRQEPALARERTKPVAASSADAAADAPAQSESSRALGNFETRKESSDEARTPEEWYADIEALRAAGRNAEADAELARLMAAYPDWVPPRVQQDR